MKQALLALSLLPCLALAQLDITETSTPPAFTQYSYSYTFSGNSYALGSSSIYEVDYVLPFGFDFKAGHELVWGTQLDQPFRSPTGVVGYSVYVKKNLVDQFYFKAYGAALFPEGKKPDYGFGVGFGLEF